MYVFIFQIYTGWNHILIIIWMFVIFFFARNYYRRHVTDVPREDLVTSETASKGTDTTATLTRGQIDMSFNSIGNGYDRQSSDPFRSGSNPCYDAFTPRTKTVETGTGPVSDESDDSDIDELGQPRPEGPAEKYKTPSVEKDLGDDKQCLDETKITLEMKD